MTEIRIVAENSESFMGATIHLLQKQNIYLIHFSFFQYRFKIVK